MVIPHSAPVQIVSLIEDLDFWFTIDDKKDVENSKNDTKNDSYIASPLTTAQAGLKARKRKASQAALLENLFLIRIK